VAATPEAFLRTLAPYREDVVVAVEGIFTWYWLSDLCARAGIAFVLGHALYLKAIQGGKAKHDTSDAHQSAGLLRGGRIPLAYVYPPAMRATRALLRRRGHLLRKRAELVAPRQNPKSQYHLPECGKRLADKANRQGVDEHFPEPRVRKTIAVDVALIEHYDQLLGEVELSLTRTATGHNPQSFSRVPSVPGRGQMLALVILYELQALTRFPRGQDFVSYGRLTPCAQESAGKRYGFSGQKSGNPQLTGACSEAATLFLRHNQPGKEYFANLERK
jgi:transposase